MANYKELYDLSLRLHFEEKARFNRIDQKASWYFSALTLLLGAAAFFGKWMLDTLLPTKSGLDVILVVVGVILLASIGLSWYLVFRVLRVAALANFPLDDQTFNLFSNYNDPTIYWTVSRSIQKFRDETIRITDKKSKNLDRAYKALIFSLVTIAIFGFLYAGRISIEKSAKGGERKMTTEQIDQSQNQGDHKPAEIPSPSAEKPDTSVALLNPQYLTEGYDPKFARAMQQRLHILKQENAEKKAG